MSRILIVDDEDKIREVISMYGKTYGYEVDEASDGLLALTMIKENSYDCVILDIMMPNMDGFTACKKIKEIASVPVIMLSARQEEYDKLYGFDLGIDDYVTKPFSPKELMARVKVIIDRFNRTSKTNENDVIDFEGIHIDKSSYSVSIEGNEVHLTNKEFELLVLFLLNPGKAFNRDVLIEKIWGYDFDGIERTVDTHIKMLRKNLGVYGDYIKTIRGVGYKFEK